MSSISSGASSWLRSSSATLSALTNNDLSLPSTSRVLTQSMDSGLAYSKETCGQAELRADIRRSSKTHRSHIKYSRKLGCVPCLLTAFRVSPTKRDGGHLSVEGAARERRGCKRPNSPASPCISRTVLVSAQRASIVPGGWRASKLELLQRRGPGKRSLDRARGAGRTFRRSAKLAIGSARMSPGRRRRCLRRRGQESSRLPTWR